MLNYNQCLLLTNQLYTDKKIFLEDCEALKRAIETDVASFSNELLAIYKAKVSFYLTTATSMLRFSPPIASLKQNQLADYARYYAEELGIRYAYSQLTKSDPYNSFSLFINCNSDFYEEAIYTKALGYTSFLSILLKENLSLNEDPAFVAILNIPKLVFLEIIPIWLIFRDIGLQSVITLFGDVNSCPLPACLLAGLEAQYKIDSLVKSHTRGSASEENDSALFDKVFSLTESKDCLFIVLNELGSYIQSQLIERQYTHYFENTNKENNLYAHFMSNMTLTVEEQNYSLWNLSERIELNQIVLKYYMEQYDNVEDRSEILINNQTLLENQENLLEKFCQPALSFLGIELSLQAQNAAYEEVKSNISLAYQQKFETLLSCKRESEILYQTGCEEINQEKSRIESIEQSIKLDTQNKYQDLADEISRDKERIKKQSRAGFKLGTTWIGGI